MYIDKHAMLDALHFQPDAKILKNPVSRAHKPCPAEPGNISTQQEWGNQAYRIQAFISTATCCNIFRAQTYVTGIVLSSLVLELP